MKVSVVLTAMNRRKHLEITLRSISLSSSKDFEVVIVDDASDSRNRIDDMPSRFGFPVRIIRINPQQKWWVNPCIPFNMGFREAKGEIILFGNAECIHFGDVISDAAASVTVDNYIPYACYSIGQTMTARVQMIRGNEDLLRGINKIVFPLTTTGKPNPVAYWYNHKKFRPRGLHFLSGIHSNRIKQLGGFDERYAKGISYDDDDFLYRVRKIGLSVEITDESRPFAIHQYHQCFFRRHPNWRKLIDRNVAIWKSVNKG